MKITCLGFHKIHKRKKSTEGPVVPTLGFKVIFSKIAYKIKFMVIYSHIIVIGVKTNDHLKF